MINQVDDVIMHLRHLHTCAEKIVDIKLVLLKLIWLAIHAFHILAPHLWKSLYIVSLKSGPPITQDGPFIC